MPNFNVYLPEALSDRVRDARESGEELNLSRLLQEAVTKELRRLEMRSRDVPAVEDRIDLERLAARIKAQREAVYRVGWEVALDWVADAPYEHLRYLGSGPDWESDFGETYDDRHNHAAVSEGREEAERRAKERDLPWDPGKATEGFVAAVEETWRLIEPPEPEPSGWAKPAEDDEIPF